MRVLAFDSPYAEGGLFVNLKTFAGCGATSSRRTHLDPRLYSMRTTGGRKLPRKTSR